MFSMISVLKTIDAGVFNMSYLTGVTMLIEIVPWDSTPEPGVFYISPPGEGGGVDFHNNKWGPSLLNVGSRYVPKDWEGHISAGSEYVPKVFY